MKPPKDAFKGGYRGYIGFRFLDFYGYGGSQNSGYHFILVVSILRILVCERLFLGPPVYGSCHVRCSAC